MKPDEIRLLYEFNAWANRRVLDAAAALTPEQFTQPLGGSFGSVRDTLGHIWGAESIWLARFQGESPAKLPDVAQFSDVASLRAQWKELEPRLLAFVHSLTEADLDTPHTYKTFKFGSYSNPLKLSLLHLVNHGSYHRGQVTTFLRQLGAQPILTDLIHYYREQNATAASA